MPRGKRKAGPKAPEPKDIEIGRLIRAQRLLCGFSQTELANAIGVTFQQLQKYEKGVNRIGSGRLYRIAYKLKVPVTFFFDGPAGAEEGRRQHQRRARICQDGRDATAPPSF